MKKLIFLFLVALHSAIGFGAGTVTVTHHDLSSKSKRVRVAWTADAADGSLPNTVIGLGGLVAKVVTDPGSPSPTDNYDIACGDPLDTNLDVFAAVLSDRDQSNTEQVYPVAAGATMPIYATTCTLQITNNSVNSAKGTIDFYVLRP